MLNPLTWFRRYAVALRLVTHDEIHAAFLANNPDSPAAIKEKNMSILSSITGALSNAEKFLLSIVTGAQNFSKIYASLSTVTISAVSAVFYDVVKSVASAEGAVAAAETANVPLVITLSTTTLTLVKQTVADFKAGEAAVVADFKELDIKF